MSTRCAIYTKNFDRIDYLTSVYRISDGYPVDNNNGVLDDFERLFNKDSIADTKTLELLSNPSTVLNLLVAQNPAIYMLVDCSTPDTITENIDYYYVLTPYTKSGFLEWSVVCYTTYNEVLTRRYFKLT
jgi:hypothetical protein